MKTSKSSDMGAAKGLQPHLTIKSPNPLQSCQIGDFRIAVYANAREMGLASALSIASEQVRLVAEHGSTSLMLMAAPSAYPFYEAYIGLATLSAELRAALRTTHFFQFDDYRLPAHSAASFRFLLCQRFFFPLAPYCDANTVHFFQADAPDVEDACRTYGSLIMEHGPDLQLKGTGENGHWGFHEPGLPLDAAPGFQRIPLAAENVAQQMRDHPGLFPTPETVPTEAFTANVPLFMRTRVLIEDNVPQASKAFALLAAHGNAAVDAAVPSSALKTHHNGILRTTAAAAWALLEYRDRGVVTAAMLERLAQSVSLGSAAEQESTRRHMRGVLEHMQLNCQ